MTLQLPLCQALAASTPPDRDPREVAVLDLLDEVIEEHGLPPAGHVEEGIAALDEADVVHGEDSPEYRTALVALALACLGEFVDAAGMAERLLAEVRRG